MKKSQHPSIGGDFPDNDQTKLYRTTGEQPAIIVNNESIIRQVIKSDPQQGYAMIFKRYYQPLCSHAVRFLYCKEAAEDIVSEVFLNFWKNKLYEKVNTTYRAYLYTAVRNNVYNYMKKEFRENEDEAKMSAMQINRAETVDPQSILLLDELFSKVEKSIASFPPQCQKVFLMSRFEGKKNREIAEALQLKLKTVEAHMMKALSTLKKSLQDYLG